MQPLKFEPQGELAQPFQKSVACHGTPTSFGVTLRRSHVHSAFGRAYRETDEGAADRQTVIAKPAAVRPSEVPNREFFWRNREFFGANREFQGRSRTHRLSASVARWERGDLGEAGARTIRRHRQGEGRRRMSRSIRVPVPPEPRPRR